jgi:hypothetical protein
MTIRCCNMPCSLATCVGQDRPAHRKHKAASAPEAYCRDHTTADFCSWWLEVVRMRCLQQAADQKRMQAGRTVDGFCIPGGLCDKQAALDSSHCSVKHSKIGHGTQTSRIVLSQDPCQVACAAAVGVLVVGRP